VLNKIVEDFLSNKSLLLGDKQNTLNNKESNLIIKNILDRISHVNENIIGVMLPRNINYILVILALWKSGRAFVPLNYNWPSSFVNLIIKRSNIKYLISDKKKVKIKTIKTILLKNEFNKNYKKKYKKKNKKKVNNKAAYTIFTSGSTGKPKGVQISKKAFITYFNWVKKNQISKKKIRHLITGEITFDIILADLAFALANKTSVFITDDPKNVFSTLELISKYKINSIYCVPSLIDRIIDAAKALSLKPTSFEFVFCGGHIVGWGGCDTIFVESQRHCDCGRYTSSFTGAWNY
jgi:bacitracin synthase 3